MNDGVHKVSDGLGQALNEAAAEEPSKGALAQQGGKAYEDHLVETLGGRGSFKSGGREVDGAFTADGASKETWYEAKSGKYWDRAMSDPKMMVSFKSSLGSVRRIAADNGGL
jgi:hypothetical protein